MGKKPTFRNLERSNTSGGVFFSQNMHPNPRYYKYYWHVFSRHSKFEDQEFFKKCRLSTNEAAQEIAKLQAGEEKYFVYNYSRPRKGPDTPFNETKADIWAPAYDDDPDVSYGKHGHK